MIKLDEQFFNKFDNRVSAILKTLRDQDYGNSEQRQLFVHLIAGLVSSKDPRGRKVIKKLGDLLTSLADEVLKTEQPIKYKLAVKKEKVLKPYKRMFKGE